jgi:hypothetical protein
LTGCLTNTDQNCSRFSIIIIIINVIIIVIIITTTTTTGLPIGTRTVSPSACLHFPYRGILMPTEPSDIDLFAVDF